MHTIFISCNKMKKERILMYTRLKMENPKKRAKMSERKQDKKHFMSDQA